jgi:hypothetical protein
MKLASCSRRELTLGSINGEDKSPGLQDGGVKARMLVAPYVEHPCEQKSGHTDYDNVNRFGRGFAMAVGKYAAVAGWRGLG